MDPSRSDLRCSAGGLQGFVFGAPVQIHWVYPVVLLDGKMEEYGRIRRYDEIFYVLLCCEESNSI